MTFDPAALKAILAAVPSTAGNITFAAVPANLGAFPDAAKQIGAHPVYDFTISYKDSKGNLVTVPVNFPAGSAAITLNYTPAAGEAAGNLFMVYVDGRGTVTWLNKSSCHNGRVLAEVPHFSTYGGAYKTPVPVFTDIAGHWAKQDIEFVAARGLLSGTGNNQFSPDGAMTRGMFVTALGRLAGVNPDSYKTRSFTDVKADAYYAAYVEWAAQKNIVKGTGDKAGGLSLIQVSGDGDARTLACDLLTQAYVPQKAQDGAFSVTGTDDRLSEALGADAAAIEEAVAGKAAEVSPQATGATWDKEVWLDYAGNVASTTFTLDDPASTVVTVVSRGGSLEAM